MTKNITLTENVTAALAERAAEILRDQLDYNFGDMVHECVTDAMEEIGMNLDTDEAFDIAMEVCSRITVVAVN